jgi:hypothetical protein
MASAPLPTADGRYGFGQRAFAGTRGNGEIAPIPDLPASSRNEEARPVIGIAPGNGPNCGSAVAAFREGGHTCIADDYCPERLLCCRGAVDEPT